MSSTPRPVRAEVSTIGAQLTNASCSRVASMRASSSARGIRSALLSTMRALRPDSSMRLASLASSAVAPSCTIDDQRGHVGAGQLIARHLGRHRLGQGVDRPAAAQAGGVHQHEVLLAQAKRGVDGIAGGAGLVVDQHPLLAQQAVDQRRLADVGLAHEGHADRAGRGVGTPASSSASSSVGSTVVAAPASRDRPARR